jgi:hypothetical protein
MVEALRDGRSWHRREYGGQSDQGIAVAIGQRGKGNHWTDAVGRVKCCARQQG